MEWLEQAKSRLKEFTEFERGWDSYDGMPVPKGVAEKALAIAVTLHVDGSPAPQFVPGGDGSVVVHYFWPDFDIEIDVIPHQRKE